MRYSNGEPVLIGDKIDLGGGMTGIVVAVIDAGEFSVKYPASDGVIYRLVLWLNRQKEGLFITLIRSMTLHCLNGR